MSRVALVLVGRDFDSTNTSHRDQYIGRGVQSSGNPNNPQGKPAGFFVVLIIADAPDRIESEAQLNQTQEFFDSVCHLAMKSHRFTLWKFRFFATNKYHRLGARFAECESGNSAIGRRVPSSGNPNNPQDKPVGFFFGLIIADAPDRIEPVALAEFFGLAKIG